MLVYVIFFSFLFFYYRQYKSPVLNYVLLFYLAAAICGVIVHYFVSSATYCTFLSVPFQIVIFFLFILPVIGYGKQEQSRRFVLLDNNKFLTLSWVLILLQLFTIIFFIGFDVALLRRGNFNQLRSELIMGQLNMGASLGRTIAGTASYYYCLNMLLFFYSLAFRKDNKYFLILLIVSSSSRIFHALTYMGRDGILFWILSFVFSYQLFKPYLNEESRRVSRKFFTIIGGFAVVLLGAISISRFSNSDSGTFLSIVNYFGQPIDNFGRLFDRFHEYKGTKALFPIFFGEKGSYGASAISKAEDFYLRYGFYSNTFSSFVGNMYSAWGPVLSLIVAGIYSFWATSRLKKINIRFSDLIVLMTAGQIVLHNYFYWAYNIRVANFYLLTLPFICLYCKVKVRR